jgi:hypothetical protein
MSKVLSGRVICHNSGDLRQRAIMMMYEVYRQTCNITDLSVEDAAGYMACGFARYLIDHPQEVEAAIHEIEWIDNESKNPNNP